MIRQFYLNFVVCVISVTLISPCSAVVQLAGAEPAEARLPGLTIPNGFGINIHFRGQPRDLDLIADAGFKFIRMDLTWEAVERRKGVYEFEKTGYDALTEGCSKRGIRILYILDYSNRLYESDRSVRTEQGRRAFAAFAEAAASRYAGKSILWEIWNESNIEIFWKPKPNVDDYCKLVEVTAAQLKKADKTGLVVAPATSTIPFKWLEDCFKRGLLNWIDVLSVHPYRPHPPETVIKDYKQLRDLIKRYAPNDKEIPIISGEWGYSNINWDGARLSNEQQAQYLVREFIINLYQKIPISIWYDWKNDGTNPNEREHHFGTVTHDLKHKAAYLAAKIISSTFAGYSIISRLELGSNEDFAFKLIKDKNVAIVVWTIGSEHKVTLPHMPRLSRQSVWGDIKIVQFLGKEEKLINTAGKNSGLELTISRSPQYMLIKGE
jgi:hypothetical protein